MRFLFIKRAKNTVTRYDFEAMVDEMKEQAGSCPYSNNKGFVFTKGLFLSMFPAAAIRKRDNLIIRVNDRITRLRPECSFAF